MKIFGKRIWALSILCAILVSGNALCVEFWGGPRNSWSIGYWYWCGRLTFLHQGPLNLHWRNFYGLWIQEKSGDVYGVGFRWTRALEPGYEYRFRIFYEHLPDYIVIDGNQVWDIGTGRTERVAKRGISGTTVFFSYIPSKLGEGLIWSVKDGSYRGREGRSERLSFGIKCDVWEVPPAMCERTRLSGRTTPRYPQWKLPEGTGLTTSPRLVKHFCPMEEGSARVEIDLPLDAVGVPYRTDDVILDLGTPWWQQWWEDPKNERLLSSSFAILAGVNMSRG